VRWVFNFVEKNRDAGIDKVAKEVKEVFRARYGQKQTSRNFDSDAPLTA
jgi:hypothetical protein